MIVIWLLKVYELRQTMRTKSLQDHWPLGIVMNRSLSCLKDHGFSASGYVSLQLPIHLRVGVGIANYIWEFPFLRGVSFVWIY